MDHGSDDNILARLFLSAAHTGDHDFYKSVLLQRLGVDVHDHSDFDHVVKMIIISRKLLDTCCTSP